MLSRQQTLSGKIWVAIKYFMGMFRRFVRLNSISRVNTILQKKIIQIAAKEYTLKKIWCSIRVSVNSELKEENTTNWSVLYTKISGQVIKSYWWMPWHRQAMKDALTCDKHRGTGKRFWSDDFRMGKPDKSNVLSSWNWIHRFWEAIPSEVRHLSRKRKRNQTRFP